MNNMKENFFDYYDKYSKLKVELERLMTLKNNARDQGAANIEEQVLNKRDGIGIWDTQHISITATSPNTQIL